MKILCVAAEHGGRIPPLADYAFALRLREEAARRLRVDPTDRGLVDQSGLVAHNWAYRQFRSDNKTHTQTVPETCHRNLTTCRPRIPEERRRAARKAFEKATTKTTAETIIAALQAIDKLVVMGKQVKPLDPEEATLDIDSAIAAYFKKGAGRARQIEKFDCHPGRQSRRVSFLLFLRRDGVPEFRKYPVALRLSSRDTRQLARALAQAADIADGIQ